MLEALHRGHKTKVGTFMDKPLADVVCINCGQCINRCPTGALRANDQTDEVWAAIDDPDQARRHPDGAQPAGRRSASASACEPGHRADLPDEHGPAGLRLRPRVRHELRRRPDDHRGRRPSCCSACIGRWSRRTRRPSCRSSPVARRAGSSTSSTSSPSTSRNLSTAKSPQQMFGALHQDLLRRDEPPRSGQHRHRGPHALLGQEVRVQPAGDVRQRLQGHRLRADDAGAGQDDPRGRASTCPSCRSPISTTRSARPPARA